MEETSVAFPDTNGIYYGTTVEFDVLRSWVRFVCQHESDEDIVAFLYELCGPSWSNIYAHVMISKEAVRE